MTSDPILTVLFVTLIGCVLATFALAFRFGRPDAPPMAGVPVWSERLPGAMAAALATLPKRSEPPLPNTQPGNAVVLRRGNVWWVWVRLAPAGRAAAFLATVHPRGAEARIRYRYPPTVLVGYLCLMLLFSVFLAGSYLQLVALAFLTLIAFLNVMQARTVALSVLKRAVAAQARSAANATAAA